MRTHTTAGISCIGIDTFSPDPAKASRALRELEDVRRDP